jgi:hypothetical protein
MPERTNQPQKTGLEYGPFSDMLSKPAFNPEPRQLSGFTGGGGQAANIITEFMKGAALGRFQQFQRSELEKAKQHDWATNMITRMTSPGFNQEVAAKYLPGLYKIQMRDIQEGKPDEKTPQGAFHKAFQGIVNSVLGPSAKKSQPLDAMWVNDVKDAIGNQQNWMLPGQAGAPSLGPQQNAPVAPPHISPYMAMRLGFQQGAPAAAKPTDLPPAPAPGQQMMPPSEIPAAVPSGAVDVPRESGFVGPVQPTALPPDAPAPTSPVDATAGLAASPVAAKPAGMPSLTEGLTAQSTTPVGVQAPANVLPKTSSGTPPGATRPYLEDAMQSPGFQQWADRLRRHGIDWKTTQAGQDFIATHERRPTMEQASEMEYRRKHGNALEASAGVKELTNITYTDENGQQQRRAVRILGGQAIDINTNSVVSTPKGFSIERPGAPDRGQLKFTANGLIRVTRDGVQYLKDDDGERLMPSVRMIPKTDKNGTLLMGDPTTGQFIKATDESGNPIMMTTELQKIITREGFIDNRFWARQDTQIAMTLARTRQQQAALTASLRTAKNPAVRQQLQQQIDTLMQQERGEIEEFQYLMGEERAPASGAPAARSGKKKTAAAGGGTPKGSFAEKFAAAWNTPAAAPKATTPPPSSGGRGSTSGNPFLQ